MNNFFEQLKKEARETRLTQNEKQAMRVRLYDAITQSPVFIAPEMPAKQKRAIPSPYFFFSPKWAAALALVLVVALGSGTAFAAQGALPGNPLYAVKINVNENVQTALATTPEAKAQVNADLAETRLEEAETLAAQGKLDATTSAELAANFDEHAQAAQTITTGLQTQDPSGAAQINAQFDSSLEAHDAILTDLGDESNSTTTSEDSNSLAMHIRMHERGGAPVLAINAPSAKARTFSAFIASSTAGTSTATSAVLTIAPGASSTQATTTATTTVASTTPQRGGNQSVALYMQGKAGDALAQTQSDYAAIQSTLSSTTVSQIDAEIASIEASIDSGSQSLRSGDYAGATQSFTEGLRAAVELDTFITEGDKFNKQLLPSLLSTFGTAGGKGKSGQSTRSRSPDNK